MAQNTCGATLAAGANCTVGVAFAPNANGSVQGTLTATSSMNAAIAVLTGTSGAAGVVQLQPTLLTFPTTGVGTTSSAQSLTVTNSGSASLSGLALSVSSGFELTSNTCPATLVPGANCTVGVVFNPSSAGQQSGYLTVASSALPASQQATLAGMGFDFTAGVSGATSLTVASGQTANFTLVFTPMNGSSGTFSFACGSLPANAVCSFNPTTEQVNASATGSVTVQVATGHAASANDLRMPWHAAALLCGLVLLPVALWRRRRTLLMIALMAILMGGASSCSGSGGGTGGAPSKPGGSSTPAGTYTIPVTATANGISHRVSLSLTVD